MSTFSLEDRGSLFFADGRFWGEVDYHVRVTPMSSGRLGRIEGSLRAVVDPLGPMRFFDIVESRHPAALRMEDGRWLLCSLASADGRFKAVSDIRPPGPQPKL
jgi:hypothetical protein